ncbi:MULTISPECIES: ROK family protein [Ignavibacterium]|jgi:glucokinase-like ROK family protein|uniref:ROK family protein n=1 Tax=Ignavibacterium TaxID=795750 RepID=UPI0025C1F009|nr:MULTISPECIES: ROK family protein [Ignavibacterium]MBI5662147.1 ROK family protein [Ignavibacterium album]
MGKVRRKIQIRKNLVLKTLLNEKIQSLTELKNHTGISLPVLTNIIKQLKKENLVVQVKEKETIGAGRPPQVFKLNRKGGYIIGIDIGRTFTNFLLLDLEFNIVEERRKSTYSLDDPGVFLEEIFSEVKSIVTAAKLSWSQILGIGVAIPGIVRGQEGISETYLKFKNHSVRDAFTKKFKKPVHIEHDAKAMALGELWMGKAKGCQNVLCLNLGWGVGLGIIVDGKIYYGKDGFAGEFGHIQVVPDGDLCYCGKFGCLETVASGKALTRIAKNKLLNGQKSILNKEKDFDINKLDARSILEAANKGDQFSIELLETTGKYLGLGIGYLINLFNPEKIILGGGITVANPYLLDSIISTAMKQSLTHINKDVQFELSTLGFRAGAIGVAMLAVRDLFEVDHLNPTAYV